MDRADKAEDFIWEMAHKAMVADMRSDKDKRDFYVKLASKAFHIKKKLRKLPKKWTTC